jgi:iron complex outermembrane receptor protein
MNKKYMLTGFVAMAALAVASQAKAQAAGAPPAGDQASASATPPSNGGLQEIVVTAQRRAENLQKVPIAITAITGAVAMKTGITNAQDLSTFAPGLMAQSQAASVQIYMRGVGTDASSAGTENAVATSIDGVYVPSMASLLFNFNNIDRIEVLKGPQGTLYGRNATGGAINIITKDPSAETHVEAMLGYGNLQRTESNFYFTTGIPDKVAFAVAAVYEDQAKGAGINLVNGDYVNRDRQVGVNPKLLLTPTDRLQIRLSGIYTHVNTSYGLSYRPVGDTTLYDGITGLPGGSFYDVRDDQQPDLKSDFYMASGRVDYDLDFAKLVSISSYQDYKSRYYYDNDGSSAHIVSVDPFQQIDKAYSEELHLESQGGGPFQWIGGVYYFHDKAGYDPFSLSGLGLAPLTNLSDKTFQTTRSIAAFGQVTYEIAHGTKITAGLRYTKDNRRLTSIQTGSTDGITYFPIAAPVDATSKKGAPTWRLAVDHQFGPNVMGYASYSRGFKSGVFATAAPNNPAVNPEKLDDYEVGVKTELFDHHLRLNANAFYYNYKNIQFAIYRGTSNPLVNAAAAHIYGLDLDYQLAVVHNLTLTGGLEALHAKYSKFLNAPTTAVNTGGLGNIIVDCTTDPAPCDATGNYMEKAPKLTANTAIDYVIPLGDAGSLNPNISYYYNDGFFWGPDNRVRQPHYSLINAQFAWTNAAKSLTITAFAKNLTAKKYFVQVSEQALGDTGQAGAPRFYGVRAAVSF